MANDAAANGALTARNVMVDDRTWEALREMAHRERTSISEIVRDALDGHKPLAAYLKTTEAAS